MPSACTSQPGALCLPGCRWPHRGCAFAAWAPLASLGECGEKRCLRDPRLISPEHSPGLLAGLPASPPPLALVLGGFAPDLWTFDSVRLHWSLPCHSVVIQALGQPSEVFTLSNPCPEPPRRPLSRRCSMIFGTPWGSPAMPPPDQGSAASGSWSLVSLLLSNELFLV